jgi:methyl-accepting chemotaxis protein
MALVKTSEIAGRPGPSGPSPIGPAGGAATNRASIAQRRAQDRSRIRQEKAAERIGAATEELASGLAEAAAAAEQLRRSLEQIATAAEEAAGASEESQTAIQSLGAAFAEASEHASRSRRKTEDLRALLADAGAQVELFAQSVQASAERQFGSVEIVSALESQAANIGDITRVVGDIADQTNLLALNAAIEAARAGEQGRGFAVVADEVRAFADMSEKSARTARELAAEIEQAVRGVAVRIRGAAGAARSHAESGQGVVANLSTMRRDMARMAEGSQMILTAAVEADSGAREAQRGAEMVASAAEEQSSATIEAQRAVQQQSASLEQSQRTAEALARLAEKLQDGAGAGRLIGGGGDSAQVAFAAEQLSAAVQELSGAAGEILTAIEQISRGAHEQAAATQEATSAMARIEKAAQSTREAAQDAVANADVLAAALRANREVVSRLVDGVVEVSRETADIVRAMGALEQSGRRIDKIIDGIALVAVQTNMLAVSGSIEAARAGESGRGFAVVSADIRNLARDSAANSDRIKDMVRMIQDQIVLARRDLEQTADASRAEIGRNQGVIERLEAVAQDIDGVRAGAADILGRAGSVLGSVREVLSGTEQIAAAAEQTSGAAGQASAAARQQARGVEDLAAAIEEIASLADELQLAAS